VKKSAREEERSRDSGEENGVKKSEKRTPGAVLGYFSSLLGKRKNLQRGRQREEGGRTMEIWAAADHDKYKEPYQEILARANRRTFYSFQRNGQAERIESRSEEGKGIARVCVQ